MQRKLVELDDNPVDAELDIVAVLTTLFDVAHDRVYIVKHSRVRRNGEPPAREQSVHLGLGGCRWLGPRPNPVYEQRQATQPVAHQRNLFDRLVLGTLAETPCGGVPRVRKLGILRLDGIRALAPCQLLLGKSRLQRMLALIQRLELRGAEEHLATHLEKLGQRLPHQLLGNHRNPRDVLGDVLADAAVTAGARALEDAVSVRETDREAVYFELAEPANRAGRGIPRLLGPLTKLVKAEDVVEAEHALGVLVRRKARRCHARANQLGRAFVTQELGERLLDRLESLQLGVELGIADEAHAVGVVRGTIALDLFAQCGNFFACLPKITGQLDHVCFSSAWLRYRVPPHTESGTAETVWSMVN